MCILGLKEVNIIQMNGYSITTEPAARNMKMIMSAICFCLFNPVTHDIINNGAAVNIPWKKFVTEVLR